MSDRWDRHFLQLAADHARMSKDPSTRVGSVIVGQARKMTALRYTQWTPEMDAQLEAFYREDETMDAIKAAIGKSKDQISRRANALGLKRRRDLATQREPPYSEWLAAATQAAHEAGIRPCDVMGGTNSIAFSRARWVAWQRVLDGGSYSLAGVGRVSGWDHTSLVYGLRRLNGESAKDMRKPSYRAKAKKDIQPCAE